MKKGTSFCSDTWGARGNQRALSKTTIKYSKEKRDRGGTKKLAGGGGGRGVTGGSLWAGGGACLGMGIVFGLWGGGQGYPVSLKRKGRGFKGGGPLSTE